MSILIYSWTFIHAVYCNRVIILFHVQIVSTLARGSPFQLAPVPFDMSPSFFEHFFTLAQDVLGLSLFLIECNLYIVQQTDPKYMVKRYGEAYTFLYNPNKDTEKLFFYLYPRTCFH